MLLWKVRQKGCPQSRDGFCAGENQQPAFHMFDVLFVHAREQFPEVFGLACQNTAPVPFKICVPIVESLGHLHLKGLALEQTQKSGHRHSSLAILNWTEVVPKEELLLLE